MFLSVVQICFCPNGTPERSGDYTCGFAERKSLYAEQVIHDIGNDFRIGLESTFIAEHLDKSTVGVVGRYFSIMHDGIVKQRKRMRTSPPAGSICRITAVCRPGVSFIFFQFIKDAHIFRETDRFEGAHVPAAGKDVSAGHFGIDLHNCFGDKILFFRL